MLQIRSKTLAASTPATIPLIRRTGMNISFSISISPYSAHGCWRDLIDLPAPLAGGNAAHRAFAGNP